MSHLTSTYRSHTCGELRADHVGGAVTLSGWIHRKRDHGGVVFIDLRDHYGLTQIVFTGELAQRVERERPETVLTVKGTVRARSAEMVNAKIPTGSIEVPVDELTIQSHADTLPFQIAEEEKCPEQVRFKHRFLELRREHLHGNILLRAAVIKELRSIMDGLGFTEFQTPILTSSSPEGARDFLVPSRIHPGRFYALPQAPQQFKQLLMVAGFDRYFQIAPCFRDEDSRADRSPGEFYQLDVECSFVEQEDIFRMGEGILTTLFNKFAGWRKEKPWKVTNSPWPRFTYDEAVSRFGTDKPDLRNPLEITEISEVFSATTFRVFRSVLDKQGSIRTVKVSLPSLPSRKYFDDSIEWFTKQGGGGLAYLSVENGELKGNISKFVSPEETEALKKLAHPSDVTVFFIAAGDAPSILPPLGKLLTKLGEEFNLIDREAFRFCWIYDFPFFELDAETKSLQFLHNPFTSPQGGLEALTTQDPLSIKAFQYDMVCNGYEIASGGIRNHRVDVMYKAFELVGYSREQVETEFGGMLRAFQYGTPPHGGWANGIDRLVMLLAGEEMIRDVIAFPLAQNKEDLMMAAPSIVPEKALKEVHIQVVMPPVKDKQQ